MTKKPSEYKKQKKRVKSLKSSMEKRGYIFPDISFNERLAEAFEKASSASTRFLKNLTPRKMQEKSLYLDVLTGELIPGVKGRRLERQRAYEKGRQPKPEPTPPTPPEPTPPGDGDGIFIDPDYTDEALRVIENMIFEWTPLGEWSDTLRRLKEQDRNTVYNILMGAIDDLGREAVARNVQRNALTLTSLLEQILYDSGDSNINRGIGQQQNLIYFSTLIRNGAITLKQAREISEAIESDDGDEYLI